MSDDYSMMAPLASDVAQEQEKNVEEEKDKLPLSKVLNPMDYAKLTKEMSFVDRVPLGNQHPHRVWEYSMALRAMAEADILPSARVIDVGSGPGMFCQILRSIGFKPCSYDPQDGFPPFEMVDLGRYYKAVIAISVLEHVEEFTGFLEGMARASSDLVFLTFDYAGDENPHLKDSYHFNWLRKRIMNRARVEFAIAAFQGWGFEPFGDVDLSWTSPQVYDYSFASLCMRRSK
jgi:hypothetical protein